MTDSRFRTHAAAAFAALVLAAFLILRTSGAAFVDVTENPGNAWEAGTVVLYDDDADGAMFQSGAMVPGDRVERCIQVVYDGTAVPASVRLYGGVTGGTGLESFLTLSVQVGSGGSFGSCSGFVAAGPAYSGDLAGFTGAFSDYNRSFGAWEATARGQRRTYRFVLELADDNDAQGKSASATFTWEAHNL
jgi:hypothetical protein